MKKALTLLLLIIIVAAVVLGSTFMAAKLPLGESPTIDVPANNSPLEMSVTPIMAGRMFSKAAFAFRGGDIGEERIFAMATLLIKHPSGNLLIDSGFGSEVDAHFATTPELMQRTSKYQAEKTVAAQLPQAGLGVSDLRAVILTHAHWDHVSGLADLPGVPVWVTSAELDFVNSDSEQTALARSIGVKTYQAYSFKDGPYLGFDSSYDVFGDGAVVIVPAKGHTPGSVIIFVTLASNKRYALIGDLAWQSEGVDIPAEKPWLPRVLVGENREPVQQLLVRMHHLQKLMPELTVVPAHDQRVWDSLQN
jgi:glyoxylase-like metal-dependent hydrolase (beta-lactamase superfamily II)